MLHALCLSAFLSAQTADTLSTVRLMRAGYTEANPLMPSSVSGIVSVKAAVMSGVTVTAWTIRKRHPKWSIALFAIGAVSGTVGAWHNARVR